jgi:nicotinamidase-related amidase
MTRLGSVVLTCPTPSIPLTHSVLLAVITGASMPSTARRHGRAAARTATAQHRDPPATMPPNQIHLYKQNGQGIGLGDPLPGSGARVLEKDSWAAAIVDELVPEPEDIRVDKYRISGFWDTPLDSILKNLQIRSLLCAGVNPDQCVLCSLQDANFLGYGCVLVRDCCGTTSPAFCTEATLFNVQMCFGFVCDSVDICRRSDVRAPAHVPCSIASLDPGAPLRAGLQALGAPPTAAELGPVPALLGKCHADADASLGCVGAARE